MDILWVGIAFIFGMRFSRIKLPPLVGYLAAGAGLSAFGYEAGAALHGIAHLGVLFLLFTVGLHLRLKNIIRTEVLGTGGIHLLVSTALFIPVSLALGYDLTAALIIGIVLGFSSTVLTAKNLEPGAAGAAAVASRDYQAGGMEQRGGAETVIRTDAGHRWRPRPDSSPPGWLFLLHCSLPYLLL
jgi:predicted Kef-type K+ transport protein